MPVARGVRFQELVSSASAGQSFLRIRGRAGVGTLRVAGQAQRTCRPHPKRPLQTGKALRGRAGAQLGTTRRHAAPSRMTRLPLGDSTDAGTAQGPAPRLRSAPFGVQATGRAAAAQPRIHQQPKWRVRPNTVLDGVLPLDRVCSTRSATGRGGRHAGGGGGKGCAGNDAGARAFAGGGDSGSAGSGRPQPVQSLVVLAAAVAASPLVAEAAAAAAGTGTGSGPGGAGITGTIPISGRWTRRSSRSITA